MTNRHDNVDRFETKGAGKITDFEVDEQEDLVELELSKKSTPVSYFGDQILTYGRLMELIETKIREAEKGAWVEMELFVSDSGALDTDVVETLRSDLLELTDLSEDIVQSVEARCEGKGTPVSIRYTVEE